MKIKYLYGPAILFALLVTSPYLSVGSSGAEAKAVCRRLNSSREALSISYEGIAEGQSYSDVRLRLDNNSDCSILVETDDHDPFVFRGKKNVSVHYLLYDRRRQTIKPAYGWGDSVFTVEIGGGESVWFLVPRAHFKKQFHVAVPFRFSWEGRNQVVAGGVGGVGHYVFFLVDEIPPSDLRRN